MKSNLELALEALKLVKEEYRQALSNDESFLKLLEIKLRLSNIKDLCETELDRKVS